MKCIYCNEGDAVVTESVTNGRVILRYRKCRICKKRFFSEESTNITDENLRKNFFKIRRGEVEVE